MAEARRNAANHLSLLWRQGPDLAAFLQQVGPLSPLDLAAVLCVDQRQRWRNGQHILAEHYFQAYPAVAQDEDAAIDIIFSEYLLRQELGEVASPDHFFQRFPQFADD